LDYKISRYFSELIKEEVKHRNTICIRKSRYFSEEKHTTSFLSQNIGRFGKSLVKSKNVYKKDWSDIMDIKYEMK